MSVPGPCSRQPKPLAAGVFQPEIGSFRLCLAAEGKSGKTVRMYTEAVQWFAAAHLIPQRSRTRWEQVSGQDIQRWMVWLLGRYSDSYASNQYRALQQFFKWWAGEEDLPDPMARLRPPKVTEKLIPVSPAENYRSWRRPARAGRLPSAATWRSSRCSGRRGSVCRSWPGSSMTPRMRSAVMLTCGGGRSRSGGKGGKTRIVRISHQTALSLDRCIRVRARHAQAYRPQLWLGVNNRGPVTANGIYQVIVRRGRECGWRCTGTGSGIISATPGWTGAAPRET